MSPPLLTLTTQALTAAGFAAFGEHLAFDPAQARPVNDGWALRADTAARLSADRGAPLLAIFRSRLQALPLTVGTFERHPHSSQAFLAVSVPSFLVVVAPSNGSGLPDLTQAAAFVGRRGEGINYRPGVWHAPIMALDAAGDFLMLIWEDGSADDCLIHHPPTPLHILA